MLYMDCHTHTAASPDGSGTVEQLCTRALELHLPVLTVTDHVEMNRFFSQGYYGTQPRNAWEAYDHVQVMETSLSNITALKGQYDGLTLLCGMEMGQPQDDFALSASVVQDQRLDFVIASLHELTGKEDFFNLDYAVEPVEPLLTSYFDTLYRICTWGKFDVLGHITYPLRYMVGEAGLNVDLSPYTDQIVACFDVLIREHKGIELNTSGLRQNYGKTFPDVDLLQLYHDMGGKILTLGSDAHCAQDLAKGIDTGARLAHEAGFTKLCYFVQHEPVWVSLDDV